MGHHHHVSRRRFVRQAACAAVTSTSLLSTLANLKFINAASIANSSTLIGGDYKALVCICLLYTSPSPRDRTRSRMPSSA